MNEEDRKDVLDYLHQLTREQAAVPWQKTKSFEELCVYLYPYVTDPYMDESAIRVLAQEKFDAICEEKGVAHHFLPRIIDVKKVASEGYNHLHVLIPLEQGEMLQKEDPAHVIVRGGERFRNAVVWVEKVLCPYGEDAKLEFDTVDWSRFHERGGWGRRS